MTGRYENTPSMKSYGYSLSMPAPAGIAKKKQVAAAVCIENTITGHSPTGTKHTHE